MSGSDEWIAWQRISVLEKQIRELKKALDKYGQHTDRCTGQQRFDSAAPPICICGLDAALEKKCR